jgi:Protein of unknown function (DUF732)
VDGVRQLLAPFVVFAVIALAVPARGAPGYDDVSFLATVRDAGITYTSPDRAISSGKAVCGWISTGKPGPEVVGDLQRNNPGMTTDHATLFVAIAVKYYCPQQATNNQPTAAR